MRAGLLLLLPMVVLTGCKSTKAERVIRETSDALPAAVRDYRVGCGDILEVRSRIRPDWDSLVSVDVDGTLPLPESLGKPRVQGLTIEEIRQTVAKNASLDPEGFHVRLVECRAAKVTVLGPVNCQARTLPYCGPEPVLEFLVRIGAIEAGTTNLNRVYVLRPNVARGEKAEVFHIDVDAVTIDQNQTTNLPIRPGDQIYVGETQRSSFSRLLPAWARPLYRSLVGMLPIDSLRGWELRE